jgi:hypothetical protein
MTVPDKPVFAMAFVDAEILSMLSDYYVLTVFDAVESLGVKRAGKTLYKSLDSNARERLNFPARMNEQIYYKLSYEDVP